MYKDGIEGALVDNHIKFFFIKIHGSRVHPHKTHFFFVDIGDCGIHLGDNVRAVVNACDVLAPEFEEIIVDP